MVSFWWPHASTKQTWRLLHKGLEIKTQGKMAHWHFASRIPVHEHHHHHWSPNLDVGSGLQICLSRMLHKRKTPLVHARAKTETCLSMCAFTPNTQEVAFRRASVWCKTGLQENNKQTAPLVFCCSGTHHGCQKPKNPIEVNFELSGQINTWEIPMWFP